MHTSNIAMDRTTAKQLYREYKKHAHWQKPVDWEVQRAYQLIAAGKTVIKALQSIVEAGVDANGHPVLAIAPADADRVVCRMSQDGSAVMDSRHFNTSRHNYADRLITERSYVAWPRGSFDVKKQVWRAQAQVPSIPLYLKPKRGLQNYHVLFEAVWSKAPPLDPLLLRRIGKADLWLVCAGWDLTEVERAALATRV